MNLRERAAFAYLDQQTNARADITRIALRELRRVLEDDTIDQEADEVYTSTNPSAAEFEIDGIKFRVTVAITTTTSTTSNAGMEWDETKVVVYCRDGGKDMAITSLADIGKVFKGQEIPVEIETVVAPEPPEAVS